MGTFTEYRERVQEREKKLEADYSTKIISFSEEVLAAKKDFEQRMKHFQSLQVRFQAVLRKHLKDLSFCIDLSVFITGQRAFWNERSVKYFQFWS